MLRIRPIKTPGKVFSYLFKKPSHSQLSVTYRLMGMMAFKQSVSKLPVLRQGRLVSQSPLGGDWRGGRWADWAPGFQH